VELQSFKAVRDSDMRTLLVRTKRFANRHSENLAMSLADILPDGKCRKQAIDGMRKFVQKPGENWPSITTLPKTSSKPLVLRDSNCVSFSHIISCLTNKF
jgi:hypothetical protein